MIDGDSLMTVKDSLHPIEMEEVRVEPVVDVRRTSRRPRILRTGRRGPPGESFHSRAIIIDSDKNFEIVKSNFNFVRLCDGKNPRTKLLGDEWKDLIKQEVMSCVEKTVST